MNVLLNVQHFQDRGIMRAQASKEPLATKSGKLGTRCTKVATRFRSRAWTITWLGCKTEMSKRECVVVCLNCLVCTKYNE